MKIYSDILDKNQKSKLIILSLFLLVGMIIEVLSLGVLLPLISIIVSKPEENIYYSTIVDFFSYLNINQELILPFLSLIILSIYTFKSLYLIYLNYRKNRFISNLTKDVSNKIYKSKIYSSYSKHVKEDSAKAIKNLQSDLIGFHIHIEAYISIIIESLLAASIIVFIIFIEPFTFLLSMIFFGSLSIIYYNSIKSKMAMYGYANLDLDLERNKIILESFHGMKDIKVLNIADKYFTDFKINAEQVANIKTKYATVVQFPRFIFETLAIYGLFFIMAILFYNDAAPNEVIEILGIFTIAILKLIPSINKLMQNIQNIKYSSPALESIKNGLSSLSIENIKQGFINMNSNLEIKNLYFSHEDKGPLLDNVNIKILKGEIIGISGESGSGKSTLADILLGLYKPKKGQLYLDGKKINFGDVKIGYVPQKVFFKNSSFRENIAFGEKLEEINDDQITNSLEMSQLDKFVKSLEKKEDTLIGENGLMISGGQQQRIGIARALYRDPEILILDESTNSLDKETEKNFINSLNLLKRKKTMILITHDKNNLRICDRKFIIKNQKLIEEK